MWVLGTSCKWRNNDFWVMTISASIVMLCFRFHCTKMFFCICRWWQGSRDGEWQAGCLFCRCHRSPGSLVISIVIINVINVIICLSVFLWSAPCLGRVSPASGLPRAASATTWGHFLLTVIFNILSHPVSHVMWLHFCWIHVSLHSSSPDFF